MINQYDRTQTIYDNDRALIRSAFGRFGMPAAWYRLATEGKGIEDREDRQPLTSPLRYIYSDWDRRFREALMRGWHRKLELLVAALRRLHPTKYRILKAHVPPLVGLPQEFWDEWADGYVEDILPYMEEAIRISADMGMGEMDARFSVGTDPGLVNSRTAEWALSHTMNLVRRDSPMFTQTLVQTDINNLQGQLSSWLETGETFPELVTRLNTVLNNPARAAMIAATESTRAFAAGQIAAWEETGVVNAMRWETARDEMVCPICRPLAGQTALMGEMFGGEVDQPPAHVNCRCWVVPMVVDSASDYEIPGGGPEPLSGELSSRVFDVAEEGNRAMDAVFTGRGSGRPARPTVVSDSGGSEATFTGRYSNRHGSNSPVINMPAARLKRGARGVATYIHEYGHYVDYRVLTAELPGMASEAPHRARGTYRLLAGSDKATELGEAMRAWEEAVKSSDHYKGIQKMVDSEIISERHGSYLGGATELWARSFTQYTADYAGDVELSAHIQGEAGRTAHTQWNSSDFAPIREAMDEVFRLTGLRE